MTVGERIQKHRKALGLSQEELGQKLLVSRQTISLWEKDQTVPTIDNLLRLRDIFGISVDEILGAEQEQQDTPLPLEEYRFAFTKEELKEIDRLQRKPMYQNSIRFALPCIFLIVSFIVSSAPGIMIGFAVGMLFIGSVSHVKGILANRKAWKGSVARICQSTYEYKLFENYMEITITRMGERVRQSKCHYTDIEKIQSLGKWLFLQWGGQVYIIGKSELAENSALYSYIDKQPAKEQKRPASKGWNVASIALFLASLLSILIALDLVHIVSNKNMLFVENFWLFFLVIPIPIASIVFGIRCKHKKNLIIGIIMTALLCLFGMFSLIFANIYDHSDTAIRKIEQTVGIDIPEHKQISTQDWTKGTQSVSRGYIYSTSNIYFDHAAVEEFEKQLVSDDKWLSSIPSDMIGITSSINELGIYDYVLIYNVDTAEYNILPSNSGKFRFVSILYILENNQMCIVEYDIDYVK